MPFLLAGEAAALEYAEAARLKVREMADQAQIEDLVAANRILSDQGVVDGFGHVSARHEQDTTRFLLARSMAPGLVTADDILEFDLDGDALDPQGRTLYVEGLIHSEIYKAHPEIKAIVHSHSPSIIPFGGDQRLAAANLPYELVSRHWRADIRDPRSRGSGDRHADPQPGTRSRLARRIGKSAVVLMRGHGNVVVGDLVEQVVFRAIYTEINAKLEAEALRFGQGEVNFLNTEEAAKATATNNAVLSRPWELWKRQALARG